MISLFFLPIFFSACNSDEGSSSGTKISKDSADAYVQYVDDKLQQLADIRPKIEGQAMADSVALVLCDCLAHHDFRFTYESTISTMKKLMLEFQKAKEGDENALISVDRASLFNTPDVQIFEKCGDIYSKDSPLYGRAVTMDQSVEGIQKTDCSEDANEFFLAKQKLQQFMEQTIGIMFADVDPMVLKSMIDANYKALEKAGVELSEKEEKIKALYKKATQQ